MGSRYLTDLADVCRRAGLPTIEVEGWQKRARGSGGFDSGRPNHVMAHHTASGAGSDGWPDVNYCTYNDEDAPLCNLYLNRGGQVWVCAGGATNTNGSGSDPCGVTNDDSMNSSAIGIEAGNNGTGELWTRVQTDAYITLCDALCSAYGIPTSRTHSHWEWAPQRKSDPAGPDFYSSPPSDPAGPSALSWNMDAFRADLSGASPAPHTSTRQAEDDDDVKILLKSDNNDTVFIYSGTAIAAASSWAALERGGGLDMWDQNDILVLPWDQVQNTINQCWVGGPIPDGFVVPPTRLP